MKYSFWINLYIDRWLWQIFDFVWNIFRLIFNMCNNILFILYWRWCLFKMNLIWSSTNKDIYYLNDLIDSMLIGVIHQLFDVVRSTMIILKMSFTNWWYCGWTNLIRLIFFINSSKNVRKEKRKVDFKIVSFWISILMEELRDIDPSIFFS